MFVRVLSGELDLRIERELVLKECMCTLMEVQNDATNSGSGIKVSLIAVSGLVYECRWFVRVGYVVVHGFYRVERWCGSAFSVNSFFQFFRGGAAKMLLEWVET
ncbi:hypothetical protein E2542_SST11437 [Spatholobus suberectus]|nr:hypothetical protein E2542_SST11437 [Spatholobus suberectus]